MTKKLFIEAIAKVTLGIVLVGLLVFLPAGTLSYFQGWLFMGVLFIPMILAGFVMMFKKPDLLKKRLNAKEKEAEQDLVVKLSGLMFIVGFVGAGLNYRFDWYVLPRSVSVIGAVVFLVAYALYAEVMRENAYLSRTIVVDTTYSIVHLYAYNIWGPGFLRAVLEIATLTPISLIKADPNFFFSRYKAGCNWVDHAVFWGQNGSIWNKIYRNYRHK